MTCKRSSYDRGDFGGEGEYLALMYGSNPVVVWELWYILGLDSAYPVYCLLGLEAWYCLGLD